MPSVSEAVGQFAGAVREVLGLTRHSRLRHQIDDTLDLFGKAKSHPELGQAAVFLGAAVEEQSRQLLVSILPGRRRKWNWSAFLGGLFVVAIAAGIDWLLWQLSDHWWVLVPFYVVAVLGALFLLVALSELLGREGVVEPQNEADAAAETIVH